MKLARATSSGAPLESLRLGHGGMDCQGLVPLKGILVGMALDLKVIQLDVTLGTCDFRPKPGVKAYLDRSLDAFMTSLRLVRAFSANAVHREILARFLVRTNRALLPDINFLEMDVLGLGLLGVPDCGSVDFCA